MSRTRKHKVIVTPSSEAVGEMEARDGSAEGEVDPVGICVRVCLVWNAALCVCMFVFKSSEKLNIVHIPSRYILKKYYESLMIITEKKRISL